MTDFAIREFKSAVFFISTANVKVTLPRPLTCFHKFESYALRLTFTAGSARGKHNIQGRNRRYLNKATIQRKVTANPRNMAAERKWVYKYCIVHVASKLRSYTMY